MDEITTLQAETLRILASPRRLAILQRLEIGPCGVGQLAEDLGLSQPNVSQHLSVLRAGGLVEGERVGRAVRYQLADPNVMLACAILRDVLERRHRRLAEQSEPGRDAAPSSIPSNVIALEVVSPWTNR